jgi:urease accessory protein
MITVNKLIAQGRGLAPVLVKRAATLALDWDTRQKSRFDAEDSQGRTLAVFLPRGSVVRGGDVLVTEDGSLVAVQAAPQPVMVVRPCAEHGQPFDLLRAAYHLGNRHVPVDLRADRLQFEPDPVLAEMLRRMHLTVTEEQAGFEPEGGAYQAGGHNHGHGEAHGHDHGAAHSHDHGDAHAPAPARGKPIGIAVSAAPAPHVHGPGCGHDHGHGHDDDHKH